MPHTEDEVILNVKKDFKNQHRRMLLVFEKPLPHTLWIISTSVSGLQPMKKLRLHTPPPRLVLEIRFTFDHQICGHNHDFK
jgi:hypothetical protein